MSLDSLLEVVVSTFSIVSSCFLVIKYFKKSITAPIERALDDLNKQLSAINESKKRNERTIYDKIDEINKHILLSKGEHEILETKLDTKIVRVSTRVDNLEQKINKLEDEVCRD